MIKRELKKIDTENKYMLKIICSRRAVYYSPEFNQLYVYPRLLTKESNVDKWIKNLVFIDWCDELPIKEVGLKWV